MTSSQPPVLPTLAQAHTRKSTRDSGNQTGNTLPASHLSGTSTCSKDYVRPLHLASHKEKCYRRSPSYHNEQFAQFQRATLIFLPQMFLYRSRAAGNIGELQLLSALRKPLRKILALRFYSSLYSDFISLLLKINWANLCFQLWTIITNLGSTTTTKI